MRGLLMIEPLYHMAIKGTKTQTRRSGGLEDINIKPDYWSITEHNETDNSVVFMFNQAKQRNPAHVITETCKPRYKIGEVLYLKEPYKVVDPPVCIEYAFDKPNRTYESGYVSDFKGKGYSNKLFMPASFAREYIQITGIRCERLLDISDADCEAEGCETAGNILNGEYIPFGYIDYLMRQEAGSGYDFCDNTPQQSYISLYKLANKIGKYGSSAPHGSLPKEIDVPNIWVWVYTFKYCQKWIP